MHPMLQKMTTFLDNAGSSVFQPITLDLLGLTQWQSQQPSPTHETADENYVDCAAKALMSCNLTPFQRNVIADYMSDVQNKRCMKFFLTFDQASREMWIQNMLADIQAKKDGEKTGQSMDHDGQQSHN